MVGMTRAHMADPHIVKKVIAGLEARIRPCVGATYCPLDRIYEGNEALCIHNPRRAARATVPHVVSRSNGPATTAEGCYRRGRAGGVGSRTKSRPSAGTRWC